MWGKITARYQERTIFDTDYYKTLQFAWSADWTSFPMSGNRDTSRADYTPRGIIKRAEQRGHSWDPRHNNDLWSHDPKHVIFRVDFTCNLIIRLGHKFYMARQLYYRDMCTFVVGWIKGILVNTQNYIHKMPIIKSRDYVYGTWWYLWLRITKKLFQSETTWEAIPFPISQYK